MPVNSCNSFSEIPHFLIFKWKRNIDLELQKYEGGCFKTTAGSGTAGSPASPAAARPRHTSSKWIFSLFLQAEHLAAGVSFGLLSGLALVFSAFKDVGYDDPFSLMHVSFLPSFLSLPLSLSAFLFRQCVIASKLLLTMLKLKSLCYPTYHSN